MIEIIPPVDQAEELRNQWANEVKAKIDKMNRRSSKPYEFEKELENAKKKSWKNQSKRQSVKFIILDVAIVLLVAALCFTVYKIVRDKEEQEEREYIEAMIEEASIAEHEVQGVQEPAPVVLPGLNYTYDELELLAHLIEAESGGDSEDEMWYTGSVVLNRINSGKYPDTLEEVIYQRGQYECTWNGHIEKEPSDIAYEVAAELLANGGVIPDYVIYQSEFTQGDGIYEKVNNTYYCY